MTYRSIAEVKAANAAAGYHWFDRDTMRFFKSRVHGRLYCQRFFVSSEQPPDGVREYSVREALPGGHISTVGEYGQYATAAEAHKAAKDLCTYHGVIA